MIHFVLHDAKDTVAVVVVEGVKAGMEMQGWIMDADKMTHVVARQDIPIGHKVAGRHGPRRHGLEVRHRHGPCGRADQGRRACPCAQHQDEEVVR